MTVYTGRKVSVWVGIEDPRGTAVTPARYFAHVDFNAQDRVEHAEHEGNVGSLGKTLKKEVIKTYSEIALSWNVGIESIGYFLLAILGSVSSAETVGTGAYKHDFSMSNDNLQKTLTISEKNGVESLAYSMCACEKFTLDFAQDNFVKVDMSFKGAHSESATLTPSYSDEVDFVGRHLEVFFADNLAGLDSATAICVETGSIEITKQIEQLFCLWELEPKDVIALMLDLQGNLTIRHKDNTFTQYYDNGTVKAMRVRMKDSTKTIGVSDVPSLDIDVPKVKFDGVVKDGGRDDVIRQNITVSSLVDLENPAFIKGTLTNTTNAYS